MASRLRRARTTLLLRWAAVAAAGLAASGCAGGESASPRTAPVRVYAAASLVRALEDVSREISASEGIEVRTSFAASSTLAQQVRQGAPADLFVSAHPEWMDLLEREGLLEPGTRRDLLSNRLVLITPAHAPLDLPLAADADLPARFNGRLALADPDAVPAGRYARRALEAYGWWEALRDRLAVAADVRGALALVERGECELGVVYRSDAQGDPRLHLAAVFPEEATGPVVYPVAAVAGRLRPEVRTVLLALSSPAARRAFERAGFEVLAPGDGAPDLLGPAP